MDLTKFSEFIRMAISEAREALIEAFDPDYVLLGGSLGKGDWIEDDSGKLLSDFEIIFISSKNWSRKEAQRIASDLSEKFSAKFHTTGYSKKRILKKQPSNLCFGSPGYVTWTYFDSIKSDNVVYSSPDSTFGLPSTSVEEVPAWEAWKLFVNRIGDLLQLCVDAKVHEREADYIWLRTFQAAADTLLYSLDMYVPDISERYKNWQSVYRKPERFGLVIPRKFLALPDASLRSRKEHKLNHFVEESKHYSKEEMQKITLYFLERIEKTMFEEEGFSEVSYEAYIANKPVINKYSGLYFGRRLSNIYSNLFLLLFGKPLGKFYRRFALHKPWRHISLLSISALFKEIHRNESEISNTRKLIGSVYKNIHSLDDKRLIPLILSHWEILRF
jgi:hypothetical protein